MTHWTTSRAEWVARYARWLDRFAGAGAGMPPEETRLLAEFEYQAAFDASPELTAARLILGSDWVAQRTAAEYSTAILLRKVRAQGFRIAQ